MQVIALKKPKRMRIHLDGHIGPHARAKDVALRILSVIGSSGGRGYTIEYAGPVARALPVEGRLTLCNLTIEMGSRTGLVAPDDTTFSWLYGRPWAPKGAMWERALAEWKTLGSDSEAEFDAELSINCSELEPQITWGTDPGQVMAISGRVPDPADAGADRRPLLENALRYMG